MPFRKFAFVSLLSLLSLPAFADDKGFYLGAGVTSIETDDNALSDEDNSYKVYGGYRANGYLAFEGAIVDLGKFKDDNLDFEGHWPRSPPMSASLSVNAFACSAVSAPTPGTPTATLPTMTPGSI